MHAPIAPPGDGAAADSTLQEAPRSFARQALHDTFSNWRARFGMAWILVLAFLAAFAPFIASSHPYLLKVDGQWSSPLLRHLTPADVVLAVVAVFTMALVPLRRFTLPQKSLLVMGAMATVLPLALWPSVAWRNWAPGMESISRKGAYALLFGLAALDMVVLGWVLFRLARDRVALGTLFGVMGLLGVALALFPVDPPKTVVLKRYRLMEATGTVQYILRPPVPYSPGDYLRDQRDSRLNPPSWQHWMGTDANSADLLSRTMHASRIAMAIGFISTGIAVVIGVIIGGVMGFFVGKTDILGMRLVEVFQAIPTLFLLIAFVAFFGRNLYLMMAIIGFVSWTGYARFIRAEFLKLRNQDFVQAAIAAGLPLRSVLFRHMLPNGITPVLVGASFGVASAILAESTLSFLGLGLVEEPSWGQTLDQARTLGRFVWWITFFPGLAIFLTVFAYNLVGESFRDAIDPRILKE